MAFLHENGGSVLTDSRNESRTSRKPRLTSEYRASSQDVLDSQSNECYSRIGGTEMSFDEA
jgi:hypothetical protein